MELNTHMPSSKKRRGEKHGYAGKAEYFGVYCPEIGNVCMVDVAIAPKTAMHLRFKSVGRPKTKIFQGTETAKLHL